MTGIDGWADEHICVCFFLRAGGAWVGLHGSFLGVYVLLSYCWFRLGFFQGGELCSTLIGEDLKDNATISSLQ